MICLITSVIAKIIHNIIRPTNIKRSSELAHEINYSLSFKTNINKKENCENKLL